MRSPTNPPDMFPVPAMTVEWCIFRMRRAPYIIPSGPLQITVA